MKILIIILSLILPFSVNANNYIQDKGVVYYVVDGDTLDIKTTRENLLLLLRNGLVDEKHINLNNSTFRLRLANIDTEESVHQDSSKNTNFGKTTSNYVKSKTINKEVVYECYRAGYYGRSICSLSFDGEDLGYHLIKNGYSSYLTDFGNHPTLHWQYRRAQAENAGNKVMGVIKRNEVPETINNFRNSIFQ